MPKILREIDFYTICKAVRGADLPQYGIPNRWSTGAIFEEHVDDMLAVVAEHPELHVASFNRLGYGYNRFIPGMLCFFLCRGASDPEIEFSPDLNPPLNITPEQNARTQAYIDEALEAAKTDPVYLALRNKFTKLMK